LEKAFLTRPIFGRTSHAQSENRRKSTKAFMWGLISTFYALADINSNANKIEERALVRGGALSAFSRLGSAFG